MHPDKCYCGDYDHANGDADADGYLGAGGKAAGGGEGIFHGVADEDDGEGLESGVGVAGGGGSHGGERTFVGGDGGGNALAVGDGVEFTRGEFEGIPCTVLAAAELVASGVC